jgi:hypothetical protein
MHKEKEMRILNIATKRKWYIQIPFKTEIRGQGEPPKSIPAPYIREEKKNVWNSWIYWIK